MLMGCILFTVTENSFESLRTVLDTLGREWQRMWLAMKASRRRQQVGNRKADPTPPRNQATGPTVSCKAKGTWALGTSVNSNEGKRNPSGAHCLPEHTWVPAATSLQGLAVTGTPGHL